MRASRCRHWFRVSSFVRSTHTRIRSAHDIRHSGVLGLRKSGVRDYSKPPQQHQQRYVVAEGGEAKFTEKDAKAFLQERGRGAYTTARTFKGVKVFDLQSHLNRTIENLEAIAATPYSRSEVVDATKKTMTLAINRFKQQNPSSEIRLTVIATPDTPVPRDDGLDHTEHKPHPKDNSTSATTDRDNRSVPASVFRVACHAAPLPEVPTTPVTVEIRGRARENAKVKDSKWVMERKEIEALVSKEANEFLLVDQNACITEGSQTNFYALIDGKVYTAGEGILEGTVRRLLLHVCEREGIPVVLQPPSISSLMQHKWEGCAISSTSRLLLPVGKVVLPQTGHRADLETDPVIQFEYPEGSLMRQLSAKVAEEIEAWSTEVLPDDDTGMVGTKLPS
mmetsp:Transcript_4736/g.6719  ORF Transcript_4736/g.6719 Transcript_4736/m.6719 type:complete len:393 (-) Transcript_4736:135-1313(-)|eukprot:CAMPEP_0184491398 /NCGR_PEP_ID=MMETSP0113_2-20130426/20339_1 /TAXON_ID=91329 /ORGANISM="Norrisiella sphaerica, Strain BC52" /LENGTH=392 /DNA_ID=CAMNT_0026875757 /DNA_START=322 /DNA_END=1500 /DNA_ORIENTATION=-